jgi:hypothetical protein
MLYQVMSTDQFALWNGQSVFDVRSEMRFHEKELTFHKEAKVWRDGDEIAEESVIIHISAKLEEENHQTKLQLRTEHNFDKECPMRQFNVTLSR